MNMKYSVAAVLVILLFDIAHASDMTAREQIEQQTRLALADGQCSAVLMKVGQTTVTPGHYVSDRLKLHECQYVQEMVASSCVKLKTCPSYAAWSQTNPDFSPALPREKFEKM